MIRNGISLFFFLFLLFAILGDLCGVFQALSLIKVMLKPS